MLMDSPAKQEPTEALTAQGQFGDLFGGINALFSGLALAGVVTAVILQSHELQLQRTELTKTAVANQKAAEAPNQQIAMQLRAAELAAISSLLDSVNSQLVSSDNLDSDVRYILVGSRRAYHARLHEVLNSMNRGIGVPNDHIPYVEKPAN